MLSRIAALEPLPVPSYTSVLPHSTAWAVSTISLLSCLFGHPFPGVLFTSLVRALSRILRGTVWCSWWWSWSWVPPFISAVGHECGLGSGGATAGWEETPPVDRTWLDRLPLIVFGLCVYLEMSLSLYEAVGAIRRMRQIRGRVAVPDPVAATLKPKSKSW